MVGERAKAKSALAAAGRGLGNVQARRGKVRVVANESGTLSRGMGGTGGMGGGEREWKHAKNALVVLGVSEEGRPKGGPTMFGRAREGARAADAFDGEAGDAGFGKTCDRVLRAGKVPVLS